MKKLFCFLSLLFVQKALCSMDLNEPMDLRSTMSGDSIKESSASFKLEASTGLCTFPIVSPEDRPPGLDLRKGMGHGGQSASSGMLSSSSQLELVGLKALAEKGDIKAQNQLGKRLYDRGYKKEALTWFEKAAKQGFLPAQNNYGILLYRQGEKGQGLGWLYKAASCNCLNAMNNLGHLCAKEKNPDALIHFLKAAEKNHPKSLYDLAQYYMERHQLGEAFHYALKLKGSKEYQWMSCFLEKHLFCFERDTSWGAFTLDLKAHRACYAILSSYNTLLSYIAITKPGIQQRLIGDVAHYLHALSFLESCPSLFSKTGFLVYGLFPKNEHLVNLSKEVHSIVYDRKQYYCFGEGMGKQADLVLESLNLFENEELIHLLQCVLCQAIPKDKEDLFQKQCDEVKAYFRTVSDALRRTIRIGGYVRGDQFAAEYGL